MTPQAALARLARHEYGFATECADLGAAAIREVLASADRRPLLVFLQMLVAVEIAASDADVEAAWRRALAAYRAIHLDAPWESVRKLAAVRALAADSAIVAAIQATVAHRRVDLDWLAVLVADAGDGSIDALVSHLHDDAELLERLRPHAGDTPPLRALLARSAAGAPARRATSPALDLADELGLSGRESAFWCRVPLMSGERNPDRVWRVQGSVEIDSRAASWFAVRVSQVTGAPHDDVGTSFDDRHVIRDALELGRCEPRELPAWLARTASALQVSWEGFVASTSGKQKAVERWLRGG